MVVWFSGLPGRAGGHGTDGVRDMEEMGLTALQMRTLLSVMYGVRYVEQAAEELGVRVDRVRYWCNDKQDESKHRSTLSVKKEFEELFIRRVRAGDAVPMGARIDKIADAISYLDTLYDEALNG